MYNLVLFLGFAADAEFEQSLSRVNPKLLSLLTSGKDYLSELSQKSRRFLGKPVSPFSTVHQLESLEEHLLSLLRKLAPDYDFSNNPPVLLAHFDDHTCE